MIRKHICRGTGPDFVRTLALRTQSDHVPILESVHDFDELPAARRNTVTLLEYHVLVAGPAIAPAVLVNEDFGVIGNALCLHSLDGEPGESVFLWMYSPTGTIFLLNRAQSDEHPREGQKFSGLFPALSGVNSTRFYSS